MPQLSASLRISARRAAETVVTDSATELAGHVITKELYADIRDEFAPFEKIEGMAKTPGDEVWVVLDNDGGEVESRLVEIE